MSLLAGFVKMSEFGRQLENQVRSESGSVGSIPIVW